MRFYQPGMRNLSPGRIKKIFYGRKKNHNKITTKNGLYSENRASDILYFFKQVIEILNKEGNIYFCKIK